MNNLTFSELADMRLMFGRAHGDSVEAKRLL